MTSNVVYMEQAKRSVAPKQECGMYMGQRYMLQFNPNADGGLAWTWVVRFTRTYDYVGYASTLNTATNAARRQIRELVNR